MRYALGEGHHAPVGPPASATPGSDGREVDGLGRKERKTRHAAARRAEAREVTFRSKLERDVLEELWRRAEAVDPQALVVREPMMDLFGLWKPGMGTPLRWRPDALMLWPGQLSREPDVIRGHWQRPEGHHLFAWLPEVHEAKTKRTLESRDYVLRLAAFRAAFPMVPVYVWRRHKGQIVPELLRRLNAPRVPPETGS